MMDDLETQESPSMEETIGNTLKEIESRGETLDKTPEEEAEVAEPEASVDQDAPEEESEAEDKSEGELAPRKAPSSWRKEAQEVYAKLDPVAQDEIDRREADFHKGLEAYRGKAQIADAFEKVITPYMANIQAANSNPLEAINYFFGLDHAFRHGTKDQRAQIIRDMMQRAQLTNEEISSIPQPDPALTAIQQEINQIKNQWQQQQTQSQQAEMAQLNSEIANFAQGREHFETVRQDMAALLQAGRAKDLEEAYEMATWANPQVRAALQAKQQEEAKAQARKQASEARKAASVNIQRRGAPAQSSTKPVGSMEDTIREKMREMGIL